VIGLDWVVTAVGLVGFVLAGRRVWWAWWVNVANQVLWAALAVLTEQWGFLVGVAVYVVVFWRNAVLWTRGRSAPDPVRWALANEASWLEAAHANSERHGYSPEVRRGFGLAAGWVRRHAEAGPPEMSGDPLRVHGVGCPLGSPTCPASGEGR
jgi:hypothetical protein